MKDGDLAKTILPGTSYLMSKKLYNLLANRFRRSGTRLPRLYLTRVRLRFAKLGLLPGPSRVIPLYRLWNIQKCRNDIISIVRFIIPTYLEGEITPNEFTLIVNLLGWYYYWVSSLMIGTNDNRSISQVKGLLMR